MLKTPQLTFLPFREVILVNIKSLVHRFGLPRRQHTHFSHLAVLPSQAYQDLILEAVSFLSMTLIHSMHFRLAATYIL